MTDLELIHEYIDKCRDFITPQLYREMNSRNLLWVVNYLPKDKKEARAIAYSRLAKKGKTFGDEEIDNIASLVSRLEDLRDSMSVMSMTECNTVIPLLDEMQELSIKLKDYFKN